MACERVGTAITDQAKLPDFSPVRVEEQYRRGSEKSKLLEQDLV
jgi:hypothetical protein